MLCCDMLCYVMLCYVMLCYVMLCYVMLCYVMLCYAILSFFVILIRYQNEFLLHSSFKDIFIYCHHILLFLHYSGCYNAR